MSTALISVSNKEGVIEFAKKLEQNDYQIISTGGTFKVLEEAGIKNLKKVEEITGFPEIMDGRVKTLNPKIFGGILADRSKPEHLKQAEDNNIGLIDLVVCNLYPFADQPGIENIDIGGPSLLRAAAKNFEHILVVCDPDDYDRVAGELNSPGAELKKYLASKVFEHTARYDRMIADYFAGQAENMKLTLEFEKISDLRYGENPHQTATFYRLLNSSAVKGSLAEAEILHGKELSYNNIMDADAAINLIREFANPAAAVIKHTNPCGCAEAEDITTAFKKAYAADSLSAFGGVIVLNRDCTKEIAEEINKVFAELVIAPDFEPEALEVLQQKKNLRIIKLGQIESVPQSYKEYKKVIGGLLEQDYDNKQLTENDLEMVTKTKPEAEALADLIFAWKVVKHVKSNAIVLVKDRVTVGIGAGQMSRVDAVEQAIKKAGDNVAGCVVASDAFFPFRDSIDKLSEHKLKSIIQPGGSVKDAEVIQACDESGLAMVFTGVRAFKH